MHNSPNFTLREIAPDVSLCIFDQTDAQFSNNVSLIKSGNKTIIIDTGYECEAIEVKNHIAASGKKIESVFLTHHHADHFSGVTCFGGIEVMGSSYFGLDPQTHLADDTFLKRYKPDVYLNNETIISFGGRSIKAFYTPGHNKCSISYMIDDDILFCGDLLIFNKYGIPSIPYIDENSSPAEHIKSLKMLYEMKLNLLIPGHGHPIVGSREIKRQIEDRLYYLEAIQSVTKKGLHECLKRGRQIVCGEEFHAKNLAKVCT